MITFERKVSIGDIPAFLLSAGALLFTLYYFFAGEQVKVSNPSRVVALIDRCVLSGHDVIGMVVPVSIANNTAERNVARIDEIKAVLHIGESNYTFNAVRLVDFRRSPDHETPRSGLESCSDEPDDLSYYVQEKSAFLPFVLAGGEHLSFELFFEPYIPACPEGGACYLQNYLPLDRFLGMLREMAQQGNFIELQIVTDPDRSTSTCRLHINEDIVRAIEKFGHFEVTCSA